MKCKIEKNTQSCSLFFYVMLDKATIASFTSHVDYENKVVKGLFLNIMKYSEEYYQLDFAERYLEVMPKVFEEFKRLRSLVVDKSLDVINNMPEIETIEI